jgi:formylglycine-generating enzyme required for sulfatase activity
MPQEWRAHGHRRARSEVQALTFSAFARVPAGWFTMGTECGQDDEGPPHRVFVDSFELAVFPVTRAEYAAFLVMTKHEFPRDWSHPPFTGSDLPVVGVSWNDAVAYCAWRSSEEARTVRLPTEAEWEYAARGGGSDPFPWGNAIPGWIPNAGRGPLEAPWPVTLGEPNAFGLYGIAANVHEWCADWHDANYYKSSPERNPAGPAGGMRRASRGGSWRHAFTISRVTQRSRLDPSLRYTDYGFRVARTLDGVEPAPASE